MLRGISSVDFVGKSNNYVKKQNNSIDKKTNKTENNIYNLKQLPSGYILFKGKAPKNDIKYDDSANIIINNAKELASKFGHSKVEPQHIIQIAISELISYISHLQDENKENTAENDIERPLLLNYAESMINNSIYASDDKMAQFLKYTSELCNKNIESLNKIQNIDNTTTEIVLSDALLNEFKAINNEDGIDINSDILIDIAFNELLNDNEEYIDNYINNISALGPYKNSCNIMKNYYSQYDKRAIDAWNKLALGSSIFVTSNNKSEQNYLEASIYNTLDEKKHGDFNSDNTLIFSFSSNASIEQILYQINQIQNDNPDKKLLFIMDYDELIDKNIEANQGTFNPTKKDLFGFSNFDEKRVRFILFQDRVNHYTFMQSPLIKKEFSGFLQYDIMPIQSYEVPKMLKENNDILKSVSLPFTKDAKEKTLQLTEKMQGSYPDKLVNLMSRISEYYTNDVKRISTKEVEEFSRLASDLFTTNNQDLKITYNTGKTLKSYYGKELTKKEIKTLIEQIKTGKVDSQGIIISSEDIEVGAGKKYTAKVIAGESKIPFVEIDSINLYPPNEQSDKFMTSMHIKNIFTELKSIAKQNPYKTVMFYINDFVELFDSNKQTPITKQIKSELADEIKLAQKDNTNILVVASAPIEIVDEIPSLIKNFSRNIIVDSPAFDSNARKEVIENIIKKEKIKLNYKTKEDKYILIDKLVKLTEGYSYVEIKNLIKKAEEIRMERRNTSTNLSDFIEASLQLENGKVSQLDSPAYDKKITASHECGHATNLEVIHNLYKSKGKQWHISNNVNFITLDPRGDILGGVFKKNNSNRCYPFEVMFSDVICCYGGYSCEKLFYDMDGSMGVSSDLNNATCIAQNAIENFGQGYNTGKISSVTGIQSEKYAENVYKDLDVILKNAQLASDLITEYYKDFNINFTEKYSQLIGTENCLIDGDDFRKQLNDWIASRPQAFKEELSILDDILMDIVKASKNGQLYGKVKAL